LESGDLYYHPQPSQRDYIYGQYEEDDWYHKNVSNGTSRVDQSKIRGRPERRSSIYLDPEVEYTSGLDRNKRNAVPTPNITIYNTTRTGDERDAEFRPSRVRRNAIPGPASRSRGGPDKWTLEDELEYPRHQMRNDRSEYGDRPKLSLAEQRLRVAEARVNSERREEEAERREEIMWRKMELKWELQSEREDGAREVVKREVEEKMEKAKQENAQADAKIDRLETLIIAQHEAQLAKNMSRGQAAAKAATEAEAARKRADDDKLARLEKLILEQKDDQLRREAAAVAMQAAEREANDLLARKITEEKEAAAEMVRCLQEAALRAREEADKQAARQLAEERELRTKAEKVALVLQQLPPSASESYSVVTDDLNSATSALVNMMYGEDPGFKWYQTAKGPRRVDISDGYSARKILDDLQRKQCSSLESSGSYYPVAAEQHEREFSDAGTDVTSNSGKHHLVFSTSANGKPPDCNTMSANLGSEGFDTLFEINWGRTTSNISSRRKASSGVLAGESHDYTVEGCFERKDNDAFVDSSLLWQKLPRHGQSELYLSLRKTGWRPTYLRTSCKRL
jgi:hypothetical protein